MPTDQRALTIKFNGFASELRMEVGISDTIPPSLLPNYAPKKFNGLWDTGASCSSINQKVIDECGLSPIGIVNVQTANGLHQAEVYSVNMYLPNNVVIGVTRATKADLGPALDALIGMDVICLGDFAITNKDNKTVMSFRYPSTACIDFVSSGSTDPLMPKIGRNDPCPCGSGKKFKKCHGQ
jgi:hypothetical protein